jgi:hypothetical protein
MNWRVEWFRRFVGTENDDGERVNDYTSESPRTAYYRALDDGEAIR